MRPLPDGSAARVPVPASGRPYPQLLRGPRHRWWRSLLGAAVVVGGVLVLAFAAVAVVSVAAVAGGLADLLEGTSVRWLVLGSNLALALLTPLAVLAVWAGHGYRPGWVSSVVGHLRWRWMLAVGAVTALLLAVAMVAVYQLLGWPSGTGDDVVALLLVVALTTPLQAAGEEYLFRGWLTQAVGALFARAGVAVVASAVVSASLFALAHGAQDTWLLLDRFAFGLLASYLVWRTGGLEAAVAVHAVNNVVVFVPAILTGTVTASLEATTLPPEALVVDVMAMAVVAGVVTVMARRWGVRRLTDGEPLDVTSATERPGLG